MIDLPDPLVAADVDIRDFPYMPLDVVRLRDSDIATKARGDEFRCAVLLWCAAWHQTPAASLPDDDDILSQYAGFGRVVREWKKIKSGALRGWIKCSDGRLYHPVVAEKANDAWRAKLEQRWRTECARIKKHIQRHSISLSIPDFEVWMSQGCPQGQPLPVPETTQVCPQGQPLPVPETTQVCPQGQHPNVPRETYSKRSEVKGREGISKPTTPSSVVDSPPSKDPNPPENATRQGALCRHLRTLGIDCAPHLQAWATLLPAHSDEEIIAAAQKARETKPGERIHLNYLVPILADRAKPRSQNHDRNADRAATVAAFTGPSRRPEPEAIDGTATRIA